MKTDLASPRHSFIGKPSLLHSNSKEGEPSSESQSKNLSDSVFTGYSSLKSKDSQKDVNYFEVIYQSSSQPQIDALVLLQGNELIGNFKVCNDNADFI